MPTKDMRNRPIAPRNGCEFVAVRERVPFRRRDQRGHDRHRRQEGDVRPAKPAPDNLGVRQRHPDAHRQDRDQHRDQAHPAGAARPILQVAFGLEHDPGGAEQRVAEHEREPGKERKRRHPVERRPGEVPSLHFEALDEGAEHDPLREGRDQRAAAEGAVPETTQRLVLEAELESDAAKHQRQQHDDRRNDDRERERKRRQQAEAAEHEPGLVAVPHRIPSRPRSPARTWR